MNEPMNEPMTTAEETERLSIENEKLRKEVLSLRRFIDSMQNLMDAVENPRPDEEIMGLLSQVLSNALETINAKDGSLLVLDEETEELVFVLTDEPHSVYLPPVHALPKGMQQWENMSGLQWLWKRYR